MIQPIAAITVRKPVCILCHGTADLDATVVGLFDFFVCQACFDKPEKPQGWSFLQRLLQKSGRHQLMEVAR